MKSPGSQDKEETGFDSFDPSTDYPLSTVRPDLVTTPSGLRLGNLTMDAVREGSVADNDLRATAATLGRQAAVAREAGRPALAANLERAAELAALTDQEILDLYTALRPGRSTEGELQRWAERLQEEFGAPKVAAFVRQAAEAYRDRNLLR